MAETMTFTGVEVRYLDVRLDTDGSGCYARLHVRADYSEKIAEAMDWEAIPTCVEAAQLSGSVAASHLTLTPKEKELRKHEVQMSISGVDAFEAIALRGDDGQLVRRQLRFRIRTEDPGAPALLASYLQRVGGALATAKVSYVVQDRLFAEAAAAEDAGV